MVKQIRRVDRRKYKKPAQASKSIKSPTGTGGIRTSLTNFLINLAPNDYLGQTVSTHPTFAWYVKSSKPYPIKFFLYHLSTDKEIITDYRTEMMTSKPGIMQISLPNSQPELRKGVHYFWHVTMLYKNVDLNDNPKDESQFQVKEISSVENSKIQKENDPLKKAELYAENSLWYDAFAQTLLNSQDRFTQSEQILLINDLAEEENEPQRKDMLIKLTEDIIH